MHVVKEKDKSEFEPLTIHFEPEELKVLAVLLANVGGEPKGHRKVCEKFLDILLKNGYLWTKFEKDIKLSEAIYFKS